MPGTLRVARVEGGLTLEQREDGRIRLRTGPPKEFERRLIGRSPQDAVFLAQQISADGSVAHGLAALLAWERAGNLPVSENGRQLRELMLVLAQVQANVRHFYLNELPDYLPWSTLADYDGDAEHLLELAAALDDKPRTDWTRAGFDHPFSAEERDRLWDHCAEALRRVGQLQRMLAALGGKFPMVMSMVPGGVNVNLTEQTLLKQRAYLSQVRGFLETAALDDATLVAQRYPNLRGLGRGLADLLCTGSGEDETAVEAALFPSGVLLTDRLEPFSPTSSEAIGPARYQVPSASATVGVTAVPFPEKQGAYSWIKSPRYQGRAMDTGAYARLVITYLSGARLARPALVDDLERLLGEPVRRTNTVAARMVARMGELGTLLQRAEVLLDQIDPAQPTVARDIEPFRVSGEGLALLESPAGSLRHRVILERGRIVHYDVVAPGTWIGAPLDGQVAGSLETALNRNPPDLAEVAGQRTATRIVHSFAFSSTDAVQ